MKRLLPVVLPALVALFSFTFAACSSVPEKVGNTGSTPSAVAALTPVEKPTPPSTASNSPTFIPATALPSPDVTPTGTPTPVPVPTAFVTAPPAGESVAIPILMYHHFQTLDPDASVTLRTWTVSPTSFGGQLDYLVAHGYHTITFAQLDSFFERGTPLPVHPIILTFDDGWREDYDVAFPALQERGMVGTFFVPTAYADAAGKTLIGWSQISEMDAAGMEFGGHTINHANLKSVSKEEALRQLLNSKSKMEAKLGHATVAFAYPFGGYNLDVVALVQQAGYRAAVGLCCGFKVRAEQLLILPRIRISYDDTLEDFAKRLPPPESP